MMLFFYLLIHFILVTAVPLNRIDVPQIVKEVNLNATRRILNGVEAGDTRPYMVYLRPAAAVSSDNQLADDNWMCGGVIIHERYILTSAACIENVKLFYVISGTHKFIPFADKENECIKHGAKKAVWKCVPKSYVYDGGQIDNIRWMIGDIAVVKVEDEFNFNKRIRGCDFIPKKVAYNNHSTDYEKPGTHGSISGWGSVDHFEDDVKPNKPQERTAINSPDLLETDVLLISKKNCKKRWQERYHYIIDESMICGKDGTDTDAMSAACSEHEVNCKELFYSDENEEDLRKQNSRIIPDFTDMSLHNGGHLDTRRSKIISGGFCENDHGGPLVVGYGKTTMVIGIISACMTKEITHKCYGPFLYTSVYRYRHLISCAIDKEIGEQTCRKLLRSDKTIETSFSWPIYSDGPSKHENVARIARIPTNQSVSTPSVSAVSSKKAPLPIFSASHAKIGLKL